VYSVRLNETLWLVTLRSAADVVQTASMGELPIILSFTEGSKMLKLAHNNSTYL
jgi:hypothetical protein